MKQLIIRLLAAILMLRRKLIHSIAKDYIGKEASPLDRVEDIVACVESVTEVLTQAGVFPSIETGTWTFYQKLARSKKWVLVDTPQASDIIISPTGMSKYGKNAPFSGHVGIMGDNGIIMSNDSYTGLWQTNYNLKSWRNRYEKRGGYPVHFFRYIG